MLFEFTPDQQAVADAIVRIVEPFRVPPINHMPWIDGEPMAKQLAEHGFFDLALDDDLGTLMATWLVMEAARAPVAAEVAASALIQPLLAPDLPRPLALIADPERPVRLLPGAKAALILDTEVRVLELSEGDVESVESLFAWPMGKLATGVAERAQPIDVDPAELRRLWRIAIAAETVGATQGALDFTLDYVRQRKQFGRPIGSFQTVQHRLAEVAVRMEATRWLTLRAASSGSDIDALICCGHAQDSARLAARDLHQFNGAIGLTLEHPLHLWTYRVRSLLGELGGAVAQDRALSEAVWGSAA